MNTRPGFWRRQFLLPPTRAQTVWDLLMGLALPLSGLAADRLWFERRDGILGGTVFGPAGPFLYGFILTEVLLLGLWILLRRRVGRSAGYFAGPLLAGWLFCVLLGLLLFPFSVVGLVVVIGLLGFSPWLTAFAFFRNWRMARELARAAGRRGRLWMTFAGIVFAVTPGLALHARGRYLLHRLLESPASARRIEQAHRFPLFPARELVWAWEDERDPDRRAALSRAHVALTGSPIAGERGD